MKKEFAQFTGSIPENYDKGLGPHIFVDFGKDLANRVAATQPQRVLEIAAGTGIVSRMLRDALASAAHLTATDLNPPMLEVARQKLGQADNVELRPADAMDLPFDDETFDTVVCQFGVMFFPDKDKAYREVYRTLVPDGHYLFNVWDSFEHNPFARIAHETIAQFFPSTPPGFYQVPFSYHQLDPIKSSLVAARFQNITTEVLKIEKEIHDIDLFARGLVYGNPVSEEIRNRGTANPEEVMKAVTEALRREFGDDPGRMPLQEIIISAIKP